MLSPEARRSAVIFARVTEANKQMIKEKAKACNLEEGPFINRVFELLRTTEEGQKLMQIRGEDAGNKKPVSKKRRRTI